MKPENIMIPRDGIQVSFSQAITIDRLTGAATGIIPPLDHELLPVPGGKEIICRVHFRARPGYSEYLVHRNGDERSTYKDNEP